MPPAVMVDAAFRETEAEGLNLTRGGVYRLLYAALNARPPVDPEETTT